MSEVLLAGFAEVDITPDQEVVAVDGRRRRRSFKVHDPLKARILALRQGDCSAAIVGLDLFELGIGFDQQVLAHLPKTGLNEKSLLLSPSHVGMTPISNYGSYIVIFAQDLIIESFEKECASKVADGVRAALDSLVPVHVSSGVGHAPDVLRNRRFLRPDGKVQMVYVGDPPTDMEYTEQGVDDTVSVLRFDTAEGEQLGAFVNFGCHALCSIDRYGDITADYPRYVSDLFRSVADIPVVFTQGGLGDVVPIERRGLAARRIGRAVGAQALYAFEQIKPSETPTLGLHYQEVAVPARQVAEQSEEKRTDLRDSRSRYNQFLFERYRENPIISYPIKVITLGDTVIVHLPGEAFHDTALAIKEASPFRHTILISRATREVGYVPTPEAFEQGGSEPALSALVPASEPIIRGAVIDLLSSIRRRGTV